MHRVITTAVFMLLGTASHAESLEFRSGPERVGLLELYTSEGCSSCPPADRFLSELTEHPGVFTDFIPIALHVDYWDYIGWEDRFADPRFSERQRTYARTGGVRTVYTPGFLYNGSEWRNFFGGDTNEFPETENTGELTLTVNEDQISIRYTPLSDSSRELQAHVALLGFGLTSEVRAGENRGRELTHDFVVLNLQRYTLGEEGGHLVSRSELAQSDVSATRYGLVAWISETNALSPLQATGGFLQPAD